MCVCVCLLTTKKSSLCAVWLPSRAFPLEFAIFDLKLNLKLSFSTLKIKRWPRTSATLSSNAICVWKAKMWASGKNDGSSCVELPAKDRIDWVRNRSYPFSWTTRRSHWTHDSTFGRHLIRFQLIFLSQNLDFWQVFLFSWSQTRPCYSAKEGKRGAYLSSSWTVKRTGRHLRRHRSTCPTFNRLFPFNSVCVCRTQRVHTHTELCTSLGLSLFLFQNCYTLL